MKYESLKKDFLELQENKLLFDKNSFCARKEALELIKTIYKFSHTNDKNRELNYLVHEANQLREKIIKFNQSLFDQLSTEIQAGVRGKNFRSLFSSYTNYIPNGKFQNHYGYEDLDGLLEGILTPPPLPDTTLAPLSGMVRYQPTPASVILDLVDQIDFCKDDIFYDLGSGLGKVVALVNLISGITSIGVEIEPSYCNYAHKISVDLGLNNIYYINADARQIDLSKGTVFYLFNPFGGEIFNIIFEFLSKEAKKRKIMICSYGSCTPYIAKLPWLQIFDEESNHDYKLAVFSN